MGSVCSCLYIHQVWTHLWGRSQNIRELAVSIDIGNRFKGWSTNSWNTGSVWLSGGFDSWGPIWALKTQSDTEPKVVQGVIVPITVGALFLTIQGQVAVLIYFTISTLPIFTAYPVYPMQERALPEPSHHKHRDHYHIQPYLLLCKTMCNNEQ